MKSVGHDLSRDNSIHQELVADIHVKHLFVVRELRQACVDGFDDGVHDGRLLRSTGVVARENSEYKDLRLGLLLLELFDNETIAVDDLSDRIGRGVVRAKHENDQFRLKPFEFAVLHAPQHTLSCITRYGKVGRFQWSKIRFPYFSTGGFASPKRPVEPVGDRVADKEEVDVALLCYFRKRLVPGVVPLIVKRNIGGSRSAALSCADRRTTGSCSTRGCLSLS